MSPSPSPLYSALEEAFAKAGWRFRPVEGREVVEAEFEAHHTKVCLHAQVFAELHTLAVVAEASLRGEGAPSRARLAAVAELLMRANRELSVGAFEMDWDGGVVLFRVSNVFAQGHYDAEIIASRVHTSIVEMDRMAPCLSILGGTPESELEKLDLAALLAREDLLPAVGEEGT